MSSIVDRLQQIPVRAYLLTSVIIFAAANSVTRKLTDLGAQNLIDGRNPISFCNVLFVGNLCALMALLVVYRSQLQGRVFQHLSLRDWWGLLGVALLSGALAPALFFAALDQTAVNNVILVGRIEPPLMLALSVGLLRARVNSWVVAGAVVSFVGVVLTVVLQTPQGDMVTMSGFQIGTGELMTAGGAVAAALGGILSQVALQNVPLGFFNVVRTTLGTVIFFVVALQLYGSEHFMDVASPLLWQWMLLYGAVIVVGGQLCWFAGLRRSTASEVSLANSFSPLAGVFAAFLILGEAPTGAQYLGGFVILIGIALNQIGIMQQSDDRVQPKTITTVSEEVEMSSELGFKGI
ncbi:DMT family transporter [Leptolyngbya sp. PCC 6406]|uniref:DMT family transporter n=1 Tax=Leptolyngbya sp. PCC 6406 TaxID=1173264 RepID=UPI0002AD0D6E|nr:DMT family transporter [Leptolyngbya sp. PCC 6406]